MYLEVDEYDVPDSDDDTLYFPGDANEEVDMEHLMENLVLNSIDFGTYKAKCFDITAASWEKVPGSYADSEGPDQSEHQRTLIKAFAVRLLNH